MRNFKGALFDLDGTLIDNYKAIFICTELSFKYFGLKPPSYEQVYHTVGGSILLTLTKLLQGSGFEKNPSDVAEYYLSIFPKYMFEGLMPMYGADEILSALKERGVKLAVFTNKQQEGAEAVVKKLKLYHYFDAIVATSLHSPRKPDKAFSEYALKCLNLSSSEVVGIGDSPYDYKAADVCHIASSLVATGGDSAQSLRENCPNAIGVYKNLKDLAYDVFGIALTGV